MTEAGFSTFVMSETTRDQIRALPQELQLAFFWAVADYGIDGIEPDFEGLELAVWILMRDLIRNSKLKSDEWRAKQSEYGKMGGAPKGNRNAKKQNAEAAEDGCQKKTRRLKKQPLMTMSMIMIRGMKI